jgi:hypothetical protein
MSASIHISGTKSSIVDSVFVCRTKAAPSIVQPTPKTAEALAELVHKDMALLAVAGRVPTAGDTLCAINGHLTRIAVSALRRTWSNSLPIKDRLGLVTHELTHLPQPAIVKYLLDRMPVPTAPGRESRSLFDTLEEDK